MQGFRGKIPRTRWGTNSSNREEIGRKGEVIYRELELGVRYPEGVWGWLWEKRRGLKALCRFLTNRGMYFHFKDCIIVKSHKSGGVIEKHCLSLEPMGDLGGGSDSEVFQD